LSHYLPEGLRPSDSPTRSLARPLRRRAPFARLARALARCRSGCLNEQSPCRGKDARFAANVQTRPDDRGLDRDKVSGFETLVRSQQSRRTSNVQQSLPNDERPWPSPFWSEI
jgi:hypothetical protein